ncbi:MAG: tetratricopeptide repeat protein [Anaerolineae bacterium]|nr:tetratricopeptide repeat protein [Anaerolineae bacterium]
MSAGTITTSRATARTPGAGFVASIDNAFSYWRLRLEADLAGVDRERHNLYRVIQFGLAHPTTVTGAVHLALALYPLVLARGYWREWAPLLRQALDHCCSQDLRLRVSLLDFLGQAQRVSGEVEAAIASHEAAAALAETLDEPFALSEAYHFLARAHLDARHYALAEQYAQAVLNLPPIETPLGRHYVADSLRTLALSARSRGNFELAIRTMGLAVDIWRQDGDRYRLATGLHDLGLTVRLAGDPDLALVFLVQAAELLDGTVYVTDQIIVQYNIGVVYFTREEWPQAERAFRQIDIGYLRETGNLVWEVNVLTALGNTLLYQARYEEAICLLGSAVAIRRQLEDPVERANAIGALGEALAGQGEREQALACFDEAIALLAAFPDHPRSRRLTAFFDEKRAELDP